MQKKKKHDAIVFVNMFDSFVISPRHRVPGSVYCNLFMVHLME